MDHKEVLKLIDAGFTADEIRAMLPKEAESKPEQPAPEEPEQKKDEPAKNENQEIEKKPESKQELPDLNKFMDDIHKEMEESFKELSKNMLKMAGMPSVADIKPLGIDDVVKRFFKED